MADRYAAISDLTTRYDVRVLGDLVNDDNTRTASGILTGNAILNTMLDEATARLKASAQASGAYSEDQLDALATALDPLVVGLVCDIALGLLYRRRGRGVPEGHQDVVDAATDALDRLRKGEMVFGTAGALSAQVPAGYRPSAAESLAHFPVTNSPMFPDAQREDAV